MTQSWTSVPVRARLLSVYHFSCFQFSISPSHLSLCWKLEGCWTRFDLPRLLGLLTTLISASPLLASSEISSCPDGGREFQMQDFVLLDSHLCQIFITKFLTVLTGLWWVHNTIFLLYFFFCLSSWSELRLDPKQSYLPMPEGEHASILFMEAYLLTDPELKLKADE